MGSWNGKTIVKAADGRLYSVEPGTPLEAGETLASQDEVDARAAQKEELERFGGAGMQTLAAAEQAVRTATLGGVPGLAGTPEDIAARERVFREESPVLSLAAQGAGAAVPGLLTGGAASGVAAGLGLGARAAGIAAAIGEGAASGLAGEVEQARFDKRPVSAGNVLMWGVGGELLGRAVPTVLRLGAGKLRSVIGEEMSAAVGNPLLQAERKALDSAADVAEGVPHGPSRDELLANADASVLNTASQRMASSLDQISSDFYDMGDVAKKPARLKSIIAPTSEVHHRWAADASRSLIDDADEILSPGGARKVAPEPEPTAALTPEPESAPVPTEPAKLPKGKKARKGAPEEPGTEGNLALKAEPARRAPDVPLEQQLRESIDAARAKKGLPPEAPSARAETPAASAGAEPPAPPPAAAPSAGASGAKSIATKARKTLLKASEELDPAVTERGSVDYFIAADRAKRSMQKQVVSISRSLRKVTDLETQAELERIQQVLIRSQQGLREALEDTSIWGKGAELQRGVNAAWHDQWFKGADVMEHDLSRIVERPRFEDAFPVRRYDPSKLRSYLKQDEVGRGLTPERLEYALNGAEQMLAAHKRFGTAEPAQIARMEKAVQSVREQVALADDLQGAKARWTQDEEFRKTTAARDKEAARTARETTREQARVAREAERESERQADTVSTLAGLAVGGLAHSVGLGAAAALAGKALRYTKLLGNLTRSGDGAIKTAARGAIRGSASRALRSVERGALAAPAIGVPAATTALARFQGDYPTPETAYEARRKSLEALARDPMLLPRTIAASFGDLSESHPELYADLSARLATVAAYLQANMPSQLSASVTRPNGIPPSRSTLRDVALKWNSATMPYTVFEDVRDGLASPVQVRALAGSHPDLYEQLKRDLITEAVENPEAMTSQRKLRLDILFQEDGVAGKAYAWPLALAIKQGNQSQPAPARGAPPQATRAPSSRGINAIQSSVTNG